MITAVVLIALPLDDSVSACDDTLRSLRRSRSDLPTCLPMVRVCFLDMADASESQHIEYRMAFCAFVRRHLPNGVVSMLRCSASVPAHLAVTAYTFRTM